MVQLMVPIIRIEIIKDRFIFLEINRRLSSDILIISRISHIDGNIKTSDVEMIYNLILMLSELGGSFHFLLLRKNNQMILFLIYHRKFFLKRDIDDVSSRVSTLLDTFANLSSITFDILTKNDLLSILSILTTKSIVYFRKIHLYEATRWNSNAREPLININSVFLQTLEKTSSYEMIIQMWRALTNDQAYLVSLDLDAIKKEIQSVNKLIEDANNYSKKTFKTIGLALYTLSLKDLPLRDIKFSLQKMFMDFLSTFIFLTNLQVKMQTKSSYDLKSLLELLFILKPNTIMESQLPSIVFCIVPFIILLNAISPTIKSPSLNIFHKVTKGDIFVGWQMRNGVRIAPFYLNIKDIRRHVLILGRTGSGKTRLAKILLDEILEKSSTAIWVFDFHREYLNLLQKKDFLVFIPGTQENPLFLNIFHNPFEEPESYSSFLTSILLETLRLKGTEISAQMERALSHAIWETVNSDAPSPKKFIKNLWIWNQEAGEDLPTALYTFYAVINRLKSIFSGVSSRIFWVSKSNINPLNLSQKNVIFDLSYLFKRNLKREIFLLVNILLRYTIMALFSSENLLDDIEPPKLLILLEEGRYLVPWRKIESTMETTAIEDFITLSRKYGLGLIIISQSPYLVSTDIISNAGTIFLFNSDIPEKEYPIIDNENLRRYIPLMPPRQAIVKLSDTPALIHVEIKEYATKVYPVPIPRKYTTNFVIKPDFETFIKSLLKEGEKKNYIRS